MATLTEINELRAKRAKLAEEAQKLFKERRASDNTWKSDEDRLQFDRMFGDVEKLADQIATEERGLKLAGFTSATAPQHWGEPTATAQPGADEERAFADFIRMGERAKPESRAILEQRALSADIQTEGGYVLPPQQFIDRIIKDLDNLLWIRRLGTVIPVLGSNSLGAPSLDADPEDFDDSSETASVDLDTQMEFGKRELTPHGLTKSIKISKKLVANMPSIEAFVADRLAYKAAVTMEKRFMTGSGANTALGVFTASTQGISTSRDVTAANATSLVTDDFIDTLYGVTQSHRMSPRAGWLMSRTVVKTLAKLTDGQDRPIWLPSMAAGVPDTLLGKPVYESEYAPSTISASQYVAVFGNWEHYWIAENRGFQFQACYELYAANRQNGYFANFDFDGMPVLGAAFARLQMHS